jgi:PAS domain S-box-containing protein
VRLNVEQSIGVLNLSEIEFMKTDIDLNQLVAVVGDAVVVCDAAGLITLWNAAAEYMFGHTESEAVGHSLDMIIPERLRARHWEGYRQTMASGKTRYGHDTLRVPAIHKDGRAMSIAFTVGLIHGANHEVSGVASVIRDETSRFNDERALRKRLTELEALAATKI